MLNANPPFPPDATISSDVSTTPTSPSEPSLTQVSTTSNPNDQVPPSTSSNHPMTTRLRDGTRKEWLLLWYRPYDPCDTYSICGSFGSCNKKVSPICECLHGFEPSSPKDWNLSDWSGGCMKKTLLRCGDKRDGDKFLMMPDIQLPINSKTLTSRSVKECELACLKNCSCSAYSYKVKCLIWNGGLTNLKEFSGGDQNGSDIYIRIAASELPAANSDKKSFTIVIMIDSFGPFRYKELQILTKIFSEKLGEGSFVSVYKGALPNATLIAVKMLEGFRQGEKEFRAEISTIGRIQHVNLVCLRGFCSEGAKRLLVYEHMPNGSLNSHLFRKDSQLDWQMRFQIALGTAKGLSYLHEKCRDCIVHCDIKPANILLDVDFCPKVADFGLAKLFGREFSRVITTIRGTRGYLAPEWISGLAITSKADVYSYGMMLLEIVSGRRNIDRAEDGSFEFFPTCVARRLHNGEEILSLLDYKIEGEDDVEELYRACNVACWCIQDNELDRPSMGQISPSCLEGVLQLGTAPIPHDLRNLMENLEHTESFSGESFQIYSSISTTSHAKNTTSTSS
ncbi:hypothetical protein GIB67_021552 [Kingdonia uniflora]|uniref:Uncharacterized protein n=1 Tax=Kingdonia uniflora TaxID=39325 RepID=A0A7J7L9T9_9MAGN|nr:hypothetical protein GIB67_021552 [Kingdonia uniflora]